MIFLLCGLLFLTVLQNVSTNGELLSSQKADCGPSIYESTGTTKEDCEQECMSFSSCKMAEFSTYVMTGRTKYSMLMRYWYNCRLFNCIGTIYAPGYNTYIFPVDCGQPPVPDHGSVTLASDATTEGATAIQTCDTGYYSSASSAEILCQGTGEWTSSIICHIVDCGSPNSPTDGSVQLSVPGKTIYGSTALQLCNTGYTVTGDPIINCQSNGYWSQSVTCNIKDCGDPEPPAHGSVILPQGATTYGATATLSCETGYTLDGEATVTCAASGSWRNFGSCIIINCGSPAAPKGGSVQLTIPGNTAFGSTATQLCNTGYTLTGDSTIYCQATGSWSQSVTCTIKDCGSPTAPTGGSVQLTIPGNTTYGSTAIQLCNTGYTLTGDSTIYCQDTGSWSQSITCTIKDCGPPPSPAGGSVALDFHGVTTYGATATQSCDLGYNLVGNQTIHCESSGFWGLSIACIIRDCGSPPSPTNGFVMLNGGGITTYGATAIQSCDAGYDLTGNRTIMCEASGTWSQTITCSAKNCGNPEAPAHGSVILGSAATTYGVTATVSCETGYRLVGEASITCEDSGLWRFSATCVIINCGSPTAPTGGSVQLTIPGNTSYRSTAIQLCNTGYTLTGDSTIYCQDTGSWSQSITCTIKDCGPPPSPAGGSVALDFHGVTTYGATATQSCDLGYNLVGNQTIHCESSGFWGLSIACIIRDCGSPPSPTDGFVMLNGGGITTYGATAIQFCDAGYDLTGNQTIMCEASGIWSQSITCNAKNCGTPPAPTHGAVTLNSSGVTTYGAMAKQNCNTGYEVHGNQTIQCEESGFWSTSITCIIKDCGSPPSPNHGSVLLTILAVTTFGATATQSCNEGYNPTQGTDIVCEETGFWSSSINCTIKDCGAPPSPRNGSVALTESGVTIFGAKALQACDQGFDLSGNASMECGASGVWSFSVICNIKDCGEPAIPANGSVELTSSGVTTYSATATYSCEEGFAIDGPLAISCEASGNWSGSATCQIKDCGSPPVPVNGDVKLKLSHITTFQAVATQFCRDGYELIGNDTIRCQANGSWSSSVDCRIKDCGSPLQPLNGYSVLVAPNITTYQAVAMQFCSDGYDVNGNRTLQCGVDGTWSSSITCIIKDCGYPSSPPNGQVTLALPNITTFQAVATQTCNAGYDVIGNETKRCLANGSWSSSIFCEIKDCGFPVFPPNGYVSLRVPNITTYEATAIQSCDEGYDEVGNETIQCQANGSWSASISCKIKDCGFPSATEEGNVMLSTPNTTTSKATAMQSCNQGYEVIDTETIMCLANGMWSPPIRCNLKDCGFPVFPPNGYVLLMVPNITTYEATAIQSCDEGYDEVGNETIQCQANGSWSTSISCKIKDCGYPSKPPNGQVTLALPNITTFQAVATQTCNAGYDVIGNETKQCLANGSWSSSIFCEIKDCGIPPEPFNGHVTLLVPNVTTYESVGTQFCGDGFDIIGNNTIQCLSNGNWSTSISCKIRDCKYPPSPNNGKVEMKVKGLTTFGATATQSCNEGYKHSGNATILCQADGNWSASIKCEFKSYIVTGAILGCLGLGGVSLATYLSIFRSKQNRCPLSPSRVQPASADGITTDSKW